MEFHEAKALPIHQKKSKNVQIKEIIGCAIKLVCAMARFCTCQSLCRGHGHGINDLRLPSEPNPLTIPPAPGSVPIDYVHNNDGSRAMVPL